MNICSEILFTTAPHPQEKKKQQLALSIEVTDRIYAAHSCEPSYLSLGKRQGNEVQHTLSSCFTAITCTGNQTFSYNTQACERTCLSLSNPTLECHPTDIPIEGCNCPKGMYLNHKNECVRKSHCPCYLEDRKYILPDQSTMTGGITW